MAAQQPIPVYSNLQEVYAILGTSLDHATRWNSLTEEFETRFGRKPAYIARAPGRVNIIGEHIDYCLFGVLPAAVEHDVLIACAPRNVKSSIAETHNSPGSVIAENVHPKYTRQVFAPKRRESISSISDEVVHAEEWHMDINPKELRWESYVKAGYFGVLNRHFSGDDDISQPIPVDLLVTGTVPAGSGLSSSAAMVVASTLAFLAINGKLDANMETESESKISKGELVAMSVENEKRVGVNSGGMDQAASVVSNPSSALYISFFPKLDAVPIPLPPGSVFVCANSLVVSDKAVTAKTNYNLRVVETLVSARILAKHLAIPVGPKEKITLREVVGRLGGEDVKGEPEMDIESLMKGLERMKVEVECLKPSNNDGQLGVTLEEMIQMTGLSSEEFHDVYLSWVTVEATHFQLYKRALHVYSEALRVLQFRQICLDAAANNSWTPDVIQDLGRVMNESQTSCNELFECSCPELNELTELARKSGAIGSRLTGAGWGGCTISLVAEADVPSFIQKVKSAYSPFKELEGEHLHEVIFATKPSSGACVYKFD
ncbi:Galactokinase [Mycena floridula]|nr:Galactokinase [Mycena floridula]